MMMSAGFGAAREWVADTLAGRNGPRWWLWVVAASVLVIVAGWVTVALTGGPRAAGVPRSQVAAGVPAAVPSANPAPTAAPGAGGPRPAADTSGSGVAAPVTIRALAVTYPLSYTPAAVSGGSVAGSAAGAVTGPVAGMNPKSRPLVVPSLVVAPGAQVAFPSAPAAMAPRPGVSAPVGGQVSSVPLTGSVAQMIQAVFPAAQWENANRVSMCESGQQNAVSVPNSDGTIDRGVFQLNDGGTLQRLLTEFGYSATDLAQALDASWNVRAAALLYSERGWQPWTCAHKLGIV